MHSAVAAALLVSPVPALTTELEGPARFCGYAPIIDLLPGEKVTTLEGGIHSGSFRWEGPFGSFEVQGIGWASPAKGRMLTPPAADKPAIFAQRRVKNGYEVAIWNGAHATAYFVSQSRMRSSQMAAIKRVRLFQEGQEPSGCKLRTIFVWE
ncbi:hypothetical protein EWE75_08710 [Sphingomonas populi]|uniref:Uncharacterized protein n=1 Tax=Sphingomonas populi TaxID=2484750 RepID=A0A4Q6Y676_9SPHN|nr:hypothetical protein EWE75_08710 [Sphingomonas populi]